MTNTLLSNSQRALRPFRALVLLWSIMAALPSVAQTITVGTGTSITAVNEAGNVIYRSSAASAFNFSQSVQLYRSTDLAALPSGSTVTAIAFNKTTVSTLVAGRTATLNIYLKNTSTTALASGTAFGTLTTGATLVYSNSAVNNTVIPNTAGFWTIPFTTNFSYAGGSIEVYVDWSINAGAGSPTTGAFQWQFTPVTQVQAMGNQNSIPLGPTNAAYGTQLRMMNAQFTYTPPPPCTATPTPGNTTGPALVCSGSSFTLGLQNASSGLGVSYLWESSPDNISWGPAGGANTNASYTGSQVTPTYYRCQVTCAGNGTGTSNALLVGLNTSNFPEDFSSATFPPNCFTQTGATTLLLRGTANGLGNPGTGSARWNFYNAANATVLTLTSPVFTPFGTPMQLNFVGSGGTYTGGEVDHIFVEASSDGGLTWPTLLADLDNTPVTGELSQGGANAALFVPTAGQWATLNYILPAGSNRVRFRGVSNFGNDCYIDDLSLSAPPPCLAPSLPSVSNITGTSADVSWACVGCTGSYIVEYGLPGFVPGTGAGVGGGLGVVTSATTSATIPGLTATTQYDVRVRQNCGSGIFSTNSAATAFTTGCAGASCAYLFHLTDNFSDGWNGALVDVRLNGITVATLGPQCTACEAFVNVPICEGATVTLVCTDAGDFPDEVGLTMTDPFGTVLFETRGSTLYPGNCAITYPNPVSLSDLTVGTKYTGIGNCTPPPCVDPPVAGTISGTALLCPGGTTTLTMSNATSTGLTRQWQQSATGLLGSWTSIGGATGTSYTTPPVSSSTYFRFYLNCGAGADTSASYLVETSVFACLCVPVHPPGCGNGNITNVSVNTLNNTSTCTAPAYQAYQPVGTATTSVERAVTYNLSVTTDQSCIVSVWVDWDHDNVFSAAEWTQVATATDGVNPSTVGLSVPLGAVLGQTAMRVRSRFAGNPNGPTNACGSFGSGESEDYLIDVLPAPACLPPSALVVSNVSATGFDLAWTCASCTGPYYVEYGAPGFAPGSGNTAGGGTLAGPFAGTSATISGLLAASNYDVYVRQDCSSGSNGYSANTLTSVSTYPDCNAAQVINCPAGTGTFGPNSQGAWNFVEPLFGFTTSGREQLFFLSASVLGTYEMQLTAAVGNSIVAVYIKPVGSCDPNGWTYIATNQFTVQTFTFPIAATGQYYVLVDPVSPSLPIADYLVTFVCPPQNVSCALAEPLSCGQTKISNTSTAPNSLPPNACPFNGAPSNGPVLWYSYTAVADQEVTISTCGQSAFDTRLSVFTGVPDCSNLSCLAMNDDVAGCTGGASEVAISATTGQTYYIAVHGSGSGNGLFSISLFCNAQCTPATGNDACASASPLTAAVLGSGVNSTGDNSCAFTEGPTSCSGTFPVQGVWYSFNSGANTSHILTLTSNSSDPGYSATALSFALFSGACTSLGATNEEVCQTTGTGSSTLSLTPNTDYRLLVYNQGGVGVQGTFGIKLERPAQNDATILTILDPTASLCDSEFEAVVRLSNQGDATLTSVTITLAIDGVPVLTYPWTGSLATGAQEDVLLPVVSTTGGAHVLTATTSLPNGAVDEIPTNDAATSNYNADGQTVKVVITTDLDGSGTTWVIYDQFFSPNTYSGGPYGNSTTYTETVCLSTAVGNQWSFYLFDSFGDGICCANGNGSWQLRDRFDRSILADKGQFTTQSPRATPLSPSYANGHEFTLPLGPAQPQSIECNVFTNVLQEKINCTPVSGATSYQYEFSDPDAGFRRRVLLNRTYVQITDMQSNPLSLGQVYFLRVRADQGAPGVSDDRWGAGCEVGWSATAAYCTQLINTPGPTFSCGVTRQFAGSDKVWAQPIPGVVPFDGNADGDLLDVVDVPNPYQFRFTGTGSNSGYVRNIFRPNYICPLSWVTNPLVNGQTYDVQVQVFVGGQWKGFCGNTCQVTINNNPAQGGRSIAEETASDNVQLWPNPVRDGRVNLRIDGLADAEQNITVDVYDVFGKRVFTQEYGNSGNLFNTVLQLNSDIASGLYMVNITVNDRTYTKRLSVL
jgi:hypothetical protein